MTFKEVLQGRPLRHPLHPLLVHFPIGLYVLSLVFDLFSQMLPTLGAVQAAYYTMLLGTVMALVAAVPGLADWTDIRRDHPAWKPAVYHLVLNVSAVCLYMINLYLRYRRGDESATSLWPLVLSFAGVGLLSISGYIGGMLVYDNGIGVGRARRKTELPGDTVRASSKDSADGFATVGDATQLHDRETLRAEVDGVALTVVNLDGQLYAFQEFCTHRFGPLSEGTFQNGQVTCPWHRSCFDVNTGYVTQGPAKVDLRTFEVRLLDGKIQVRVRQ